MTLVHILFYLFSVIAVITALMVVTVKNPVHAVLFLVVTFFSMAGVWLLLNAEFLALILVLVYVGAVMTLFLFVVMMLNIDVAGVQAGFVRYLPIAAIVVLLITGISILVLGPKRFGLEQIPAPAFLPGNYSNTADLGSVLYTNFAYPFEVAGVLLLAAIIAAICLAHRRPKDRKVQNAMKQIAVRREDYIKLVNIPSEKNPSKPGQST